ncbi:YwaF family protein [Hoyosella subflava]|uniref:Integral membrane protein n=1 Tax=Hoyosella subflava (strain DSM 45089 / JCM 17490 / NBRC 109087 / DQS3-9A1) TaxID=443218 RepID=F6EKE6_HOYSD|nr:TIGR02206 family membrane protein [Hoyosella subflava]AEF39117.1 hypothetical protein AS9A_0663 [Hoyosella subflava DQS3-9A1]
MLIAQDEFSAYGVSHWAVVAVFAVGAFAFVKIGRSHKDTAAAVRFSRVLGIIAIVLYAGIFIYSMIPPSVGRSVPLQLSDLAAVTAAYALWSRKPWAFALTYYWCLVLSTQALVSPALQSPDFPHHEFIAFWAMHLLVVWAAIYLTWGLRTRPTWRSYRITVAVTLAWAAFTFTFNRIADTNYGFLNAKPQTASLLDYMGPWPWYLIAATALVFATWALMTWPWKKFGAHYSESPPRLPSETAGE